MRGYQCGMLWGSTIAAGLQAYRLFGAGPKAETMALLASQKVLETFNTRTRNRMNCCDLTGITDFKNKKQILRYFFRGGAVTCFGTIARYPPEALAAINAALSEIPDKIPSRPVTCSSMFAVGISAPAQYTTAVAGLAGGIGLSGGACGALGAAVWIAGIKELEAGTPQKIAALRISDMIDKFAKNTGSRFECSEITGRRFADVYDHAAYLSSGGCQDIIAMLVSG